MTRKLPDIPPPDLPERKVFSEVESLSIQLKLLTPMFGGSATAREVDMEAPIRAAAIRGHLRFWWRATVGAQYADSEKLFQEEAKIWGSADQESKVKIWVEVKGEGKLVNADDPNMIGTGSPKVGPQNGYFLFPFQENKKDNIPAAKGLKDVSFQLHIRFSPDLESDLIAALRAWIFFGGVGARTRRGCGAIIPETNIQQWLPKQLGHSFFGIKSSEDGKTGQHLSLLDADLYMGKSNSPIHCWQELGRFWTKFRKGHFVNPLKGKPWTAMDGGRWSDHNTLRGERYRLEIALNKPYLGLPLIYQDFAAKNGKPASFEGTLDAVHSNGVRFASPVMLKPVMFADGKVCPMIAVLRGPLPEEISIKTKRSETTVKLQVPDSEEMLEHFNVNHPLDAVCEAALNFGYTEVKL